MDFIVIFLSCFNIEIFIFVLSIERGMRMRRNDKKWVYMLGMSLCCVLSMLIAGCQRRNPASAPSSEISEESGQSGDAQENQREDGKGGSAEDGNGAGENGEASSDTKSLINPAGNTVAERFQTPGDFERSSCHSVAVLYSDTAVIL